MSPRDAFCYNLKVYWLEVCQIDETVDGSDPIVQTYGPFTEVQSKLRFPEIDETLDHSKFYCIVTRRINEAAVDQED